VTFGWSILCKWASREHDSQPQRSSNRMSRPNPGWLEKNPSVGASNNGNVCARASALLWRCLDKRCRISYRYTFPGTFWLPTAEHVLTRDINTLYYGFNSREIYILIRHVYRYDLSGNLKGMTFITEACRKINYRLAAFSWWWHESYAGNIVIKTYTETPITLVIIYIHLICTIQALPSSWIGCMDN
jgi:hypothetical protein